ncbi:hypothetical protein M427DRAFT_399650 [Gonapodya prolifera JEL478]|uniref:Uncharacterized protein n=1 Tax=Gonapodya prolifera (strain JEL478) TaxID=1344416 RepID=A0A139AU20_GONPJ|nr:hypothetical protein M427DRAFT_399650 [Gonapodya prolifera JEL478]|eukprot:KXS19995.1 hypothetical protein M427DRAFT_399650 [Gonapodya prolifera JEL478]
MREGDQSKPGAVLHVSEVHTALARVWPCALWTVKALQGGARSAHDTPSCQCRPSRKKGPTAGTLPFPGAPGPSPADYHKVREPERLQVGPLCVHDIHYCPGLPKVEPRNRPQVDSRPESLPFHAGINRRPGSKYSRGRVMWRCECTVVAYRAAATVCCPRVAVRDKEREMAPSQTDIWLPMRPLSLAPST